MTDETTDQGTESTSSTDSKTSTETKTDSKTETKSEDSKFDHWKTANVIGRQSESEIERTIEGLAKVRPDLFPTEDKKAAENEALATEIKKLHVENARTKAMAKHGLTEEAANRLTGTPEQILADAEYWASQLGSATSKKNGETTSTTETKTEQKDDEIPPDYSTNPYVTAKPTTIEDVEAAIREGGWADEMAKRMGMIPE